MKLENIIEKNRESGHMSFLFMFGGAICGIGAFGLLGYVSACKHKFLPPREYIPMALYPMGIGAFGGAMQWGGKGVLGAGTVVAGLEALSFGLGYGVSYLIHGG